MKIKTITCHEVYNHGASLQEYALLTYLESLGHEVETINYKPDYLSNHFKLWKISNPRFEKSIFFKIPYLILKLPGRLKNLKRKKNFDRFSLEHIKSTKKLFKSNHELKQNIPQADAYICGSDQIWNSFFENGKDPAFYLDFVPDHKLKISYAASFAIDQLEDNIKTFVKEKVSRLDQVSVRESSGKEILENLGINKIVQVLDPVFLLDKNHWDVLTSKKLDNKYIFVYDCDSDPLIKKFVKKIQKQLACEIVTVNSNITYANKNYSLYGPDMFLALVKNASFVVSNSFHAVAFSLIFQKQFTVFNRFEKINTRMRDIVNLLCIPDVLIQNDLQINEYNFVIDYKQIESKLYSLVEFSKNFLIKSLETFESEKNV